MLVVSIAKVRIIKKQIESGLQTVKGVKCLVKGGSYI